MTTTSSNIINARQQQRERDPSTRPALNFFAAKNSNSTEKITQSTEKNTTEKTCTHHPTRQICIKNKTVS